MQPRAAVVVLRDVTEEDLPVFYENQRDPEASRMAAFPPRDHDAFFAHWRTNILGRAEVCAKTIVADGAVAGHVNGWDAEGRRLVGYWLGREHWGRGVASAALAEFVARHETRRPLHAFVAIANVASVRVLEKCGFVPEGAPVRGEDGIEELLTVLRADDRSDRSP